MAHVLLIEPDRVLAETYLRALQSAGHTVVACAGAQAAIMAADQTPPALVILELQLVGHSGIEFLYEFRSYTEWQPIPIIIQTSVPPAEFNDSRRVLHDELNVSDYLYKPQANLGHLLEMVSQHLPVRA